MKYSQASADFRKSMRWIVLGAVVLAVLAIGYLALLGELTTHMVIATLLGVFFTFVLGAGLFALAFFSDKSGHDRNVTDATKRRGDRSD